MISVTVSHGGRAYEATLDPASRRVDVVESDECVAIGQLTDGRLELASSLPAEVVGQLETKLRGADAS